MKVLVFEHCHHGHYYHYVHHLVRALLPGAGEVVLSATEEGARSSEFRELLAPVVSQIELDTVASRRSPDTLAGRLELCRRFGEAMRRLKPDYVFVPSGDALTSMMPVARMRDWMPTLGSVCSEVCIHHGLGIAAATLKQRLFDEVKLTTVPMAGWNRVHFVNHLFYEHFVRRKPRMAPEVSLLPSAVARNPRLDRQESRRRLNLPPDGIYVGLAGSLDERRAIPELVAAFATVHRPNEHLLLAGRLAPTFRRLFEDEYADLVRRGQIVVLDSFVPPEVFDTVMTALDVVVTPYPRFGHLSNNLLNAVSAGRPVLAHDFGWPRAMVRRFNLGWTCDVVDKAAFAQALRRAMDECGQYCQGEAISRLLEFHAPENFAASLLDGLRRAQGHAPASCLRSWDWVKDSLKDDRPLSEFC